MAALETRNPARTNYAKIVVALAALLAIFSVSMVVRNHAFFGPKASPFTPFYNTESAQYFRYAEMVSRAEKIPSNDVASQSPEGFRVFEEIPVFTEYAAGFLHRIFAAGVPFRLFAEYFDWFFSGLTIVAVFLICLLFTSNMAVSLLAALYYAVSLAGIARTVNGFFEKEIFCLPVMAFHLYCFLKFVETRKIGYAAAAAVLIWLAVASWKISQFYYLIFAAYPVLKFLLSAGTAGFRREFLVFFSLQTLCLAAACLVLPHLREQLFIFSPSLVVCCVFLAMLLLEKVVSPAWWLRTILFLAAVVSLLLLLPRSKDYSFVFQIAFYKLKFFFHKPMDPSLLPPAVRAYWTGPFETPSPGLMLYSLSTFLVWGLAGAVSLTRDFFGKKIDLKSEFLLFLNIAFFSAYFFFHRFVILAVIPLAVDASVLLARSLKSGKSRGSLVVIGLLACVVFEWGKSWTYSTSKPFLAGLLPGKTGSLKYKEFGTPTRTIVRLLEWMRSRPSEAGPVLANYPLSPSILLYTGRSVVLTPAVFERRSSTARYMSIFSNLYGSEKEFYAACRTYGIKGFVYSLDYDLDNSVYSTRYIVDRTNADSRQAAYLFQFDPAGLKFFRLEYQNERFRYYSVTDAGNAGNPPGPRVRDQAYLPCYDPAIFRDSGESGLEFLSKWEDAWSLKTIADVYFSRNMAPEAESYYQRSLVLFPKFPEVLTGLGRIYLGKRRIDEAAGAFEKSLSIAYSPEALYGMTLVDYFRQDYGKRERELADLVRQPEPYLPAVVDLIEIYAGKKDYPAAVNLCERAISFHPERPDLYTRLGRLYLDSGRPDLAQQAYQAYQAHQDHQDAETKKQKITR